MSWYAIEAIEDAIEDTKQVLLPFDLGTWLRLALIVIFTGGGIGFINPVSFIPPEFDSVESGDSTTSELSTATGTATMSNLNSVTGMATTSTTSSSAFWALFGTALLGVIALFFYISSVFEFVYYQSLLDKNVSIRKNFRKHWLKGLQFFIFEFLYLILVIGLIISVVAAFMANFGFGLLAAGLSIPVFIVIAVFAGLVHDFALIQMIKDEENIVSAWMNIWADIRTEWREVFVYLVVKLGIGLAIGTALITLFSGAFIAIVIFFGILAIILGLIVKVLAIFPLILGMVLLGVIMLAATIAVRTFLYFFIIRVYESLSS